MKLKDNSPKEIDTALYQLEQKLSNKINNIEFPEQKVYDDKDIRAALETEISDRKTAIKNEADTRSSTDNTLQQLIGTETEAREVNDKTISDNLSTEITDRTNADKNLQDNIDAKQNKLIAGDNITITDDKISATDTIYTASSPIKLSGTDIQLDVVPVDKGGTGKTTAKEAFINLAEGLSEGSGPLDTESIIYRNTNGSNWDRYTLATFWGWIKSKIENVFSSLISHPSDTNNPHSVTKAQVGLGNCDNTADKDKSVKYATSAGSADNATKLATARSISITDGTNTGTASSFDGSSDISLRLPVLYYGALGNLDKEYTKTGLTFAQIYESFNGSPAYDWASYIVCNHHNGQTYYHQMLRLPFFNDKMQIQRRVGGELQGWDSFVLEKTNNTFSATNNFSGTLVIPTTSSTTNGAIWIG